MFSPPATFSDLLVTLQHTREQEQQKQLSLCERQQCLSANLQRADVNTWFDTSCQQQQQQQQQQQYSEEEPMEYPDEHIFDDEPSSSSIHVPQHQLNQQLLKAHNIEPVSPPTPAFVPSLPLSFTSTQKQKQQQSSPTNSRRLTIRARRRTLMFVNLLLKHLQDSPLSLMQVKAVVSECVQRQRSQGGNLSLMLQKELKASLSPAVYAHVHELLEWHCWQRCQQASMSIAMAQNDAFEDVPQPVVSGFQVV